MSDHKKNIAKEKLTLMLDPPVYDALIEIQDLFSEAVGNDVSMEEVVGTLVSGFVEGLHEEHEWVAVDQEEMNGWSNTWCCGWGQCGSEKKEPCEGGGCGNHCH